MRTGVKWSLGLITALLALLFLAVVAVVVVMYTERGSRWGISQLSKLAPVELDLGVYSGTLWRGLVFDAVKVEDAERRVEIDNLDLRVNWAALAGGTLELQRVDATAVSYRALETDPAPAPAQKAELLAVQLRVLKSRIGTVTYESGDAQILLRDLAVTNAWSNGRDVRIGSVDLWTTNVSVAASKVRATIGSDWPLSASLRWALDDEIWSGQGDIRGSLADLGFDQQVDGPYPALASGSVQFLLPDGPRADMLVNWEQWVLGDQQLVDGEVHALGWIDAYTLDYDTTLDALDGQRFDVAGSAAGTSEGFQSAALTLTGPGGRAEFSGSVRWSPTLEARGIASASSVDLAEYLNGMEGSVEADAHLVIDATGVAFERLRASGDVNGYPSKARGDVLLASGRLLCTDCRVDVGANQLLLDGALSAADVAMSLRIDAPRLAELLPGVSGSLAGAGSIAGMPDDLLITLELGGRELHFGDDRLPRVGTDATLTLRRNQQGVTGSLERASISTPGDLRWALQDTTQFRWQESGFSADPHRWTGTTGDVWIDELAFGETSVALVSRISELPLSLADTWLPDNLRLSGLAEADIGLRRSGSDWTGRAEWRQSDTVLRVIEAEDRQTEVRVPRLAVLARLENGAIDIDADVAIEPGVTGRLDFALAPMSPNGNVAAELTLSGDDWRWISAVVPQIDQFEGSINALIRASGPLASPALNGDLAWRSGALLVPSLNVPLREVELVVSGGTQGTATLAGTAKAGDGRLRLDGRVENLMQPERMLQLEVTGNAAEIVNWPEYRVWATPDLVFTGYADDWRVSGDMTLPRAEIALRELPVEAVAVSPDVIVLGEQPPESRPTRLTGDVDVILGEKVLVDALGLQARLTGNLSVRLLENQPVGAEGRISLMDGTFEAYGQKLKIRDGELTFTGPLDDPLVDVRAVRVIETIDGPVTAGLHLSGRAQNLNTSVFSDPAMAEADALSYLVVGRPLNQATEAEGGDLTGAAISLGLKQASRLVEQIGQSLGLDQLSLTGDGGETTALVAGKQVNKRLYARYAYGVFSRLGTLLLRYRLSDRMTLEAGAGDNQSIDILYSVER